MNDLLRRRIRDSKDSVRCIAKRCGVSQQTLQKFVSGARENIRTDTAEKLIQHFGLCLVDDKAIRELFKSFGYALRFLGEAETKRILSKISHEFNTFEWRCRAES